MENTYVNEKNIVGEIYPSTAEALLGAGVRRFGYSASWAESFLTTAHFTPLILKPYGYTAQMRWLYAQDIAVKSAGLPTVNQAFCGQQMAENSLKATPPNRVGFPKLKQ
ncbi:MAG: hypothetical protein Q4E07_06920 [Eubacteriales bacterium]|nr:hypothetical protein [Eubacteriales bacterium]